MVKLNGNRRSTPDVLTPMWHGSSSADPDPAGSLEVGQCDNNRGANSRETIAFNWPDDMPARVMASCTGSSHSDCEPWLSSAGPFPLRKHIGSARTLPQERQSRLSEIEWASPIEHDGGRKLKD